MTAIPQAGRQLTDGSVLAVTTLEIEELRRRATEMLEARDFGKMIMRSCWICNPAHLHLAEADGTLLRCFGCGKFFMDGVDITDYSSPEG